MTSVYCHDGELRGHGWYLELVGKSGGPSWMWLIVLAALIVIAAAVNGGAIR